MIDCVVHDDIVIGSAGQEMDVYLPKNVWYDWYSHDLVSDGLTGRLVTKVQTPLDHVPVCIANFAISTPPY